MFALKRRSFVNVSQFHVINRAGALPFREEPEAFSLVLNAFADAV